MKPIRLSMQAFGPFSGTEEIDFSRLGSNPLFLINGATGAGKSTILDAICFALYGQTAGNERDAAQMRCDQAEATTLTWVTLDFSLADKRYRIKRTPLQSRPKARGDGVTTQQAEAQLWHLDGSDEGQLLVAKSVTDANSDVRRLIGLDVEQFRQVMVLPQGKFRELLLADSKDREKIFGQLFQTSIYKRIEESLKTQAAGIRQAVDQHQNQIKGILHAADVNTEADIDEELTSLEPQQQTAESDKRKAETAVTEARQQQDRAQALVSKFDQLLAREKELEQLLELQTSIDAKQQSLILSLAAQKIQPEHERLLEEQQALEKVDVNETNTRNDLEAVQAEKSVAESAYQQAKSEVAQVTVLQQQQSDLRQYEGAIDELESARVEAKRLRLAAEKSSDEFENKTQEKHSLVENQKAIDTQIIALDSALTHFADKQIQLNNLQHNLGQRQALEQLRSQHRDLAAREGEEKKRHEQLQQAFAEAQTQAKQVELRWHTEQAALLAQELEPGAPCPVCGSKTHPSLAKAQDSLALVSKSQLDDARAGEEQARQTMLAANTRVETAKRHLADNLNEGKQLSTAIGALADISLNQVIADEKSQRSAVAALQDQQLKKVELQVAAEKTHPKLAALDVALLALEEKSKRERERYVEARAKVQLREKALPPEYSAKAELNAALTKLAKKIAQLEAAFKNADQRFANVSRQEVTCSTRLAGFAEQRSALELRLQALERQWVNALVASPFTDLNDYQAARLDEEEQLSRTEDIRAYRSNVDTAQGGIGQLRSELKDLQKPDLTACEAHLQQQTELQQAADSAWRTLDSRVGQLKRVKAKLDDAHTKNTELEDQYAILGTLSDVANGQTGNKISLQRFVLSVLLDDVLIQATERLLLMSKGRYRLLRKEDRAKGNKASGLELEVEDGYTGKSRAVATLSGGESFMAALSLALGLSDVVQSYAGGIKLDTLFIDEGFGSLDPESLDLAVKTLIDLQASGRMIGIISHVSELKEQMALRIDVQASRSGSCITVGGAAR